MRMVVLAALLLAGCRPDFQLDESSARGAKPHANAGIGTTVDYRSTITLDGSASVDPDGTLVGYRWTLDEAPDGSAATIEDPSAVTTKLVPDKNGLYSFTLEVTDSDGNKDASSVVYLVDAGPLMVDAGSDITVEWRKTAQLSASAVVTSGMTPAIEWTFMSKPARSTTTLQGATTLTPSFVADVTGVYELQLVVTSEEHVRMDTVTVTAAANRVEFQGAFIDAVMSIEDSTLIAISDAPPRLRFIRVPSGVETTVPLPSTPTAITLDEYDNHVAVAVSGQVRIYELTMYALTASFAVPAPVAEIVFAWSRVHCFPASTGPIQTYDVSADIVAPATYSVSGASAARMMPNSFDMFSIDTSVTPADLYRHSATSSPAELIADSPYAGEYPLGTDLWTAGDRIFVSTGHVFLSDPFTPPDMGHVSRFTSDPSTRVNALFWAGPSIHTLETTAGLVDYRVYDNSTFTLTRSYAMPDILVNGTPQIGEPRLVSYLLPDKILLVTSSGTSNMIVVTDR